MDGEEGEWGDFEEPAADAGLLLIISRAETPEQRGNYHGAPNFTQAELGSWMR